jgi:iron complex outermembrane receptor protein
MPMKFRTLLAITTASLVAMPAVALAQTDAAAAPANSSPEIIVTGQKAAQKSAIDIKRNAEVIVDSISADDVGKLPDNSVTEVLQRVVGVNITRIQTGGTSESYLGEGTGLTVRGLDKIVSQLNGRDSFSASNGRNLAWEDIPPELAQGVDVNKSASADLPEGGFGGTVNLRTRQPFDFKKLTIHASVDDNYADYAQKNHTGGNILVSNRWDTSIGEIGALVNVAYSNLTTKADGVQVSPYFPQVYNPTFTASNQNRLPYLGDAGSSEVYIPSGLNFNQRVDDRQRLGLYGALQWKPSENLQFFLTGFHSKYKLNSVSHAMYVDASAVTVVAPNSTNSFGSNGGLLSTTGLAEFMYMSPPASGTGSAVGLGTSSGWAYQPMPYVFQTSQNRSNNATTDISLGGEWKANDRLNVKFAYQYVDSSSSSDDKAAYDYTYLPGYSLALSAYGSSTLPRIGLSSSTPDLTNRANYAWLASMDHLRQNLGREHAIYADASLLVGDGLIRSVKFGAKLTLRTENDKESIWNYQALTPPFGVGLNSAGLYQSLSSFSPPAYSYLSSNTGYSELFNLSGIFHGQMGLPSAAYFPSLSLLNTDFGTIHSQLGAPGDTIKAVQYQPGDVSRQIEHTASAYGMVNFRSDDNGFVPLRGNLGLRLVAYDYHSTGSVLSLGMSSPTSLIPVTGYVTAGATGSIINNGQVQPNTVQYTSANTYFSNAGGHSGFAALPSFNLHLLPTPQLHVRLAASEGMSRPSLAQLNPRGSFGGTYVGTYESYFSGNRGNPNLKPETAEQFDLSVEWYPSKGGLVHAAAFYKQIHHYISTQAITVPYTLPTYVAGGVAGTVNGQGNGGCAAPVTYGEYCPQTVNSVMVQPFNEDQTATIKGLEFGVQKYFDFLPGPLNGLGMDFNYTYISSKQPGALAYDMLGNRINGLPLTGLSKNTLNLAVMYDKGPLSLRVAYNWRDAFLVSTAAYQTSGSYNYINNLAPVNGQTAGQQGKVITYALPVFQYASGTVDANLSYRINSHVTWVLQGSNLTQPTVRLYMGAGAQTYNRSWYTSDRRYTTSLRITF